MKTIAASLFALALLAPTAALADVGAGINVLGVGVAVARDPHTLDVGAVLFCAAAFVAHAGALGEKHRNAPLRGFGHAFDQGQLKLGGKLETGQADGSGLHLKPGDLVEASIRSDDGVISERGEGEVVIKVRLPTQGILESPGCHARRFRQRLVPHDGPG